MKNLFNLLLTFFFFQIFFAQQGANDTSFNVINDCKFGDGSGLDQKMSTMAFQIDNKIIIGGYFEKYNGENRYRIVRINYDGSIDQNYNPGSIFINSSHPSNIKSIAIQADGKAIIGGSFISNYGTSNNSFIRLNIDGTIDTTFNIGTGFINSIFDRPEINSIVIQNDGKILVGGEFTSFNGISRKNIIRLLANGTIDLTFDPGNGFDQKVNVIEVQSGNKIVIGGEFGSYNGIAQGKIIRLNFDGTIDNTFNIGLGFQNGNVLCITSQNDGKLIVGGGFQFFDTQQKKGLARLNNDGTIDNTLDLGTYNDFIVNAISLRNDGKILVGIRYSSIQINNADYRSYISQFNIDGSYDSSYNTVYIANGSLFYNNTNKVNKILVDNNNNVFIGGEFSKINNSYSQNNIAQFNSNNTLNINFSSKLGFDYRVNVIESQQNGKLIIGGDFTIYNKIKVNNIARLNIDGTLDTTFNTGSGFNGSVTAIFIQNDGKILIGGLFNTFNGHNRNKLVRLNSDGSEDSSFNSDFLLNISNLDFISSIKIQSTGKIIIACNYIFLMPNSRNILRLNSNGSFDSTFNIGNGFFNEQVVYLSKIIIEPNDKILASGQFTSFNGITRNNILRLNIDGDLDTTFISSQVFLYISNYIIKGEIIDMALQNDGKIIAGGRFNRFNGQIKNNIIRFNSDGSLDSTFNIGNGFNGTFFQPDDSGINCIIIQNDNRILIGGNFTNYDGNSKNGLVRINNNGTIDSTFSIGNGFDLPVNTISIQDNQKIIIGGYFTKYDGFCRNKIVRINSCSTSTNSVTSISKCFSYTWPTTGITYTSSGIYTTTHTNINGCDSTSTLNLTITNGQNSSYQNVSACESYHWNSNGINYDSTGIYNITLTNMCGFDSTVTLNLTINHSNSSSETIIACDSFIWSANGNTYSNSGNYIDTLTNIHGCDSIVTLNLTIKHSNSGTTSITSCNAYTWSANGNTYTNSGNYIDTLTNINGCDSIVTLRLTINSNSSSESITACNSYTWLTNGITYLNSGTYVDTLTNVIGCDSIITLYLNIKQSNSGSESITACNSYTWLANGNIYTNTGTYIDTLANIYGCDSIVTLNLMINHSNSGSVTISACNTYTWPANGYTYAYSGTYNETLLNINGCDSIVTLYLTINHSNSITETIEACDTYTWLANGNTYTYSGNYIDTLMCTNGCDSIVTLSLTINHSNSSSETITACDSYTWTTNGNTYTNSGTFIDTLTNINGCDSIVTLILTIIPSQQTHLISNFVLPSATNSCVGTSAVQLTGNFPLEVFVDNVSFGQSLTGYQVIPNLCAGVHDLMSISACSDTLKSQFVIPVDSNYVFNNPFIDSLAQDSLGITLTDCGIFYNSIDTAYIDSIWANGNTVNVIWNIVDSQGSNYDTTSYILDNGNGVYWLQLSVLCPNKTISSYYTVTEAIYFNNGSVSIAGLENSNELQVGLYPNPTTNRITINFSNSEMNLRILDVQNKEILNTNVVNGENISLIDFEPGCYLFELTSKDNQVVKRVIKLNE